VTKLKKFFYNVDARTEDESNGNLQGEEASSNAVFYSENFAGSKQN
jgi:hypothetical protein